MDRLKIPAEDWLKGERVGCSGCGQVAPFTLGEFERGPVEVDWQLRLIGTEIRDIEGRPARAWRWDLFCPGCAGDANPRPACPALRIHAGERAA